MNKHIQSLNEYIQANLSNHETFYLIAVSTFIDKVSTMDEFKRKKEDLVNKNKLN